MIFTKNESLNSETAPRRDRRDFLLSVCVDHVQLEVLLESKLHVTFGALVGVDSKVGVDHVQLEVLL